MSPEEQARLKIDDKLTQAGWVIQDMKLLNLGAAIGVAVREYPTDIPKGYDWASLTPTLRQEKQHDLYQ